MSLKDLAAKKTIGLFADQAIKYIRKNPDKDLSVLAGRAVSVFGGMFPKSKLDGIKRGAADPNNPYYKLIKNMLTHVDANIIRTLAMTLAYEAGYKGTREVRHNRETLGCNVPWLILLDPTSACNLRCKGCWAAEYGHNLSLTLEEMQSVVSQAKALGVRLFMFTGGEPLIRKRDLITLCENNRDCTFLAYTNATLIDDAFCRDLVRVGNFILALSVEGTRESNDARRGDGAYDVTMHAMDLLRRYGCFFGVSVCYTRENVDYVTSDDFIDELIAKGALFSLYFNYMPVGKDADKALIPSPAQRKYMYYWIKRTRGAKTGKPMFVFDFQDDGEYVGGCIAGGRNYFHINSRGDMEPCVFIHFSDANIREKSLLEGLRSPLFMAYRDGQPFNDNHLRPCPMLENPDKLREIVKRTGARSTDLIAEESVDELCGKCDDFAKAWQPVADELWRSNPHPKIHTQYARDNGKLIYSDPKKL